MTHDSAVVADAGQRPPGLIRFERRLGLPVPVSWRPWVADFLLSDQWTERKIARVRWVRAHRLALFLATVASSGAIATAAALTFGLVAMGPFWGPWPSVRASSWEPDGSWRRGDGHGIGRATTK